MDKDLKIRIMDIRQLRAGNLVTTNGKPMNTNTDGIYRVVRTIVHDTVKIAVIETTSDFFYDETTVIGDNLEPIEITEDLLLKIGFIKDHHEFDICLNKYSICIFYDEKISNIEIYNDGKMLDADVKYIHKLQNLIFEITDLELNVDNLITK